jgi:hypothetical protein
MLLLRSHPLTTQPQQHSQPTTVQTHCTLVTATHDTHHAQTRHSHTNQACTSHTANAHTQRQMHTVCTWIPHTVHALANTHSTHCTHVNDGSPDTTDGKLPLIWLPPMSKYLHARTCITTHHHGRRRHSRPTHAAVAPAHAHRSHNSTRNPPRLTHPQHTRHSHTRPAPCTDTCSARTHRSRCTPHMRTAHRTRASNHTQHTLHARQRRQPGHHRRKAAADLVAGQVQVPARTHMHPHSPHTASVDTAEPRMLLLRPRALTRAATALATHHGSHTHCTIVTAIHGRTSHRHTHSHNTSHAAHEHTEADAHPSPHMLIACRQCNSKHTQHTLHARQRRQPGHHRRKAAIDQVAEQVQVPARMPMHHHSPHTTGVDTAEPRMLLLCPHTLTTATTALATHHGSHTHCTLVAATHDPHHAPTHALTQHHTCSERTHRRRCAPHTAHAHRPPPTH